MCTQWGRDSARALHPHLRLSPSLPVTMQRAKLPSAVQSCECVPSCPRFAPRVPRQNLHDGAGTGRGEKRKGRKQIRISKGIKGTWLLQTAAGLPQEYYSRASGSIPLDSSPLGLWAPPPPLECKPTPLTL